jgi:hypothetical protein
LNPASKPQRKPNSPLKIEGIERAKQWKALIGTNGIESKADLARYLGVSRARVTQVLKRMTRQQHEETETGAFAAPKCGKYEAKTRAFIRIIASQLKLVSFMIESVLDKSDGSNTILNKTIEL